MLKTLGLALFVLTVSLSGQASAEVWYVNKSAPPGGDATSWAAAFQTIEPAVEAAAADGGGEVWIAAGVYDEERSGTYGSLCVPSNVAVFGGFSGYEDMREERDSNLNKCILDGSTSWNGEPSIPVVQLVGANASLDGITVTGGGVGIDAAKGTRIVNCAVNNNGVADTMSGAGIRTGGAEIEDSVIHENVGEAIFGSPSVIRRCVIDQNGPSEISGPEGGCLIQDTLFSNHTNSALRIYRGPDPVYVESCIFVRNVGFNGGAVFFSDESDYCPNQPPGGATIFTNCVFANNEAVVHPNFPAGTGVGGAVFVHTQVHPECRGADFEDRAAHPYPFDPYWPPLLINCTFVGNRAVTGGALYWKEGDLFSRKQAEPQGMVIANSIFWDNGLQAIDGEYKRLASIYTGMFSHCIMEFPLTGVAIQSENPRFRDTANGDFRLLPNSPAIDMGRDTSTAAYGSVVADYLGCVRGFDGDGLGAVTADGSDYDIGAFEYVPGCSGEGEGEGEGEGSPPSGIHTADQDENGSFDLSELLRVIQLYNVGSFHCDVAGEDGYAPGLDAAAQACTPHSSDYNPQDWRIDLNELLRAIQFYNTGGYTYCPESGTEDGFCPGGSGM
jgi:hypothetical protein